MKRKLIALTFALSLLCSIGAATGIQAADLGETSASVEAYNTAKSEAQPEEDSESFDAAKESAEEVLADEQETTDTASQQLESSISDPSPSTDPETTTPPAEQPETTPSTGDSETPGGDLSENDKEETGNKDEIESAADQLQIDLTRAVLQLMLESYNESYFTPESWQEFLPAYTAAKAACENPNATLAELQKASEDLEAASSKLVISEDAEKILTEQVRKNLTEEIERAQQVYIESDFTPETWKDYAEALAAAQQACGNPDISYQDLINAANNFYDAEDNLIIQNPAEIPGYLQNAFAYAESLFETEAFHQLDGITQYAYASYLAEYEALSTLPSADKYKLDSLWVNTMYLIHDLDIVNSDPAYLNLLIDGVSQLDLSDIVKADRNKIEKMLLDAKSLGEDATSEQITSSVDNLLDSLAEARWAAVTADLQKAVDRALALDLTQYTDETVTPLNQALAAAQALLDDEELFESRQSEVDAAADALNGAIDALVLKEKAPVKGEEENEEKESTPKKSSTPKTSDAGSLPLAAGGFAALALGGVIWTKRKHLGE